MSWNDWVLEYQSPLRLGFFLGVFALMAAWEVYAPRRRLSLSRGVRWTSNLGLVLCNALVLRLLFPAAAAGAAVLAQAQGWGVLNYHPQPFALSLVIALVAMDFVIYLQHVMVHALPLLWRLHRVHHADLDFDVTTGTRFHPLEMILSMLIKLVTITALGPPVAAVLIFEVLLNATAMFNHANIRLPEKLDRLLRLIVVTPDMHRVHHSVHAPLTNSNFGFNLPWWDRLFGTYVAQPPEGHETMEIGLDALRDPNQVDRLSGMLTLPFTRRPGEYPINRRW